MKKFLVSLIFPLIIGTILYFRDPIFAANEPYPVRKDNPQKYIKRVDMLLHPNNTPTEQGYLLSPLRIFSEESLNDWQKLRLKKWDTYDIITKDFALIATISDMKILGRIRFNFYDFNTQTSVTFEKNILPFFKPRLSATSYRSYNSTIDDVIFQQGDFKFFVKNTDLKVSAPAHYKNITIISPENKVEADFHWKIVPNHEVLGHITQIDSDPRNFIFQIKGGSIPVFGTIKVAGKEYSIDSTNAAAGFDWARGIYQYNTAYWNARIQGELANGRFLSVNFGSGYGHPDHVVASEDGFSVDKYSFKLNYVTAQYNQSNINSTWIFKTEGRSVSFAEAHVTFTPHKMQTHGFSLFVTKSDLKTVFGKFTGYVSNNEGKKYIFEDFSGYVEVYRAKW